jgi:ABC-type transporter Mla MlaB component
MATLPHSSRLLAKVAKFVRNPSVHWSDLDKIEAQAEPDRDRNPDPDPMLEPTLAKNRQMLRDMIDRKRREDAIRKSEFNQLRQLRQQAALAKPDQSDKPSSFGAATGITDLDDRAQTIRKIDEIEAQMSKQWWKGQKPEPPAASVPAPSSDFGPTTSASGDSLFASTQVKNSQIDFDNFPTMMGQVPTLQINASLHEVEAPISAKQQFQSTDDSGFNSAKLRVPERNDRLTDPDLEEAAVRFANGDDAGAESVLLTALRTQSTLTVVAQAQAEALFALYRSLGQQASFEREALNFSQQFGSPGPAWLPAARPPAPRQAALAQALVWHCPAQLDLPALAPLPSHLSTQDCLTLDWSSLKQITPPAAQQLATLFAAWCAQQGCLAFQGEQVLVELVRAATPRGARRTAAFWWSLRMDLLRVLQWQDDFELAAFEFCMTYETASSPWSEATCVLRPQASAGTPTAGPDSTTGALSASPFDVALAGELQGDVVPGLPALEEASQTDRTVVISCSQLIRVDFSAAGSILNWVARGQALGCQIEFREVPFLVAAFFNLIGINQHAQVLTPAH